MSKVGFVQLLIEWGRLFYLGGIPMNLKETRFFKKITQYELEKISGVFQSRISNAERGIIHLNKREKRKIETALDCPIDWDRMERR